MEFLVKGSSTWDFAYEGAQIEVTVKQKKKAYYFDVPALVSPMTIYLDSYNKTTNELKGRIQIKGKKQPRAITFIVEKLKNQMEGTPEGYCGNRRWTLVRAKLEG